MRCFALVLLLGLQAGFPDLPSFSDYPVEEIFKGQPAPVDLDSHPRARRFRTRLREGAKKGPNFAGHFTVVTWGCGTQCESLAVIDARTGRVHFPLEAPLSNGVCFRLESSLLIADPIDRDTLGAWEGTPPEWLETRYCNWNGSEFVEVARTRSVTEECAEK